MKHIIVAKKEEAVMAIRVEKTVSDRKILELSEIQGLSNKFVIDEGDYLTIREMVLYLHPWIWGSDEKIKEKVRTMVKTSLSDTGSRVCELEILYPKHCLRILPKYIENLEGLMSLNLCQAQIDSLPDTISQLKNLETLDLRYTRSLSKLPENIGGLSSLKKLLLSNSAIGVLPASIGRLRNLRELILSYMDYLSTLPEEIGNLGKLEMLYVDRSGTISLPDSIGRLGNLKMLNLFKTHITVQGKTPNNEWLLRLARSCPWLCHIVGIETHVGREQVRYELACNRSRFLRRGIRFTPKLWHRLLESARTSFIPYSCPYDSYLGRPHDEFSISQPDAVYRLLIDDRDSFVGVLMDRNQKKPPISHSVNKLSKHRIETTDVSTLGIQRNIKRRRRSRLVPPRVCTPDGHQQGAERGVIDARGKF